jgi:hypothetical protein
VVSGIAAILSTGAALYTASQIQGSSRQVDSAIAQIASAASAAQEEAQSLKDQVGAVRDQVKEARAQTKQISKQTDAIKSSANAAVQTANAESETAQAQLKAAQEDEAASKAVAQANLPSLYLQEFEINGLTEPADKSGMVHVTVHPVFGNNGGTMIQRFGLLNFYESVPGAPDFQHGLAFGGNEVSIAHGGNVGPEGPVPISLSKAGASAISSGVQGLLMTGALDYYDASQQPHRWCFAYIIAFPKGHNAVFYPYGGPEWHCQT